MRYERKYRITNLSLPIVHQVVQAHPFAFRKAYADRQVNNIYYDGPELDTFVENANGVPERKKFRLRWYGPFSDRISKPVFEVKFKSHLLGSKKSRTLSSFYIEELEEVNRKIREFPEHEGHLAPSLLNSYFRSYYESLNGYFRITIDSEMRFNPYIKGSFNALDQSFFPFPGIILELKYDMEQAHLADEVLQYIPFRNTKSSKYAEGLSLIFGTSQ